MFLLLLVRIANWDFSKTVNVCCSTGNVFAQEFVGKVSPTLEYCVLQKLGVDQLHKFYNYLLLGKS